MEYLAPEYLQYGKYTEKTDVFSYGVFVLDVCCWTRPIDKEGEGRDGKMINMVDFVWGLHSSDRILDAADEMLEGEFDEDGMMRLLLLGLSCVNLNNEERPSMRRVVPVLNLDAEPMTVPRVKPLLLLSPMAVPCSPPWTSSPLQTILNPLFQSLHPLYLFRLFFHKHREQKKQKFASRSHRKANAQTLDI